MLERDWFWSSGICDFCYNKHFHALAMQNAPDVFENGTWKGGVRTLELGEKWNQALKEATERLTVDVVNLPDTEGVVNKLCESCLKKILESKKNDV